MPYETKQIGKIAFSRFVWLAMCRWCTPAGGVVPAEAAAADAAALGALLAHIVRWRACPRCRIGPHARRPRRRHAGWQTALQLRSRTRRGLAGTALCYFLPQWVLCWLACCTVCGV